MTMTLQCVCVQKSFAIDFKKGNNLFLENATGKERELRLARPQRADMVYGQSVSSAASARKET